MRTINATDHSSNKAPFRSTIIQQYWKGSFWKASNVTNSSELLDSKWKVSYKKNFAKVFILRANTSSATAINNDQFTRWKNRTLQTSLQLHRYGLFWTLVVEHSKCTRTTQSWFKRFVAVFVCLTTRLAQLLSSFY